MDNDMVPPPPPSEEPPPPPSEELMPPPPPPPAKVKPARTARQPVDMYKWLQEKKAADEAAAKPKYIPRKERERLALEKRAENVVKPVNSSAWSKFFPGSAPTEPRAHRVNEAPAGPRASVSHRNGDVQSHETKDKKKPSWEEKQAAEVRLRYMGPDPTQSTFSARKKRKRTTENKFKFDWDPEEDTSTPDDPLYQRTADASAFGGRHLGGFSDEVSDSAIQDYAKAIEARDPETGQARAREFLATQKRIKDKGNRAALNKHWSEKKLSDMRERDWRIFKEDYDISTKGGSIPNPMRSWAESNLPKRLLDVVDQVGYTEPSAVQRAAIPIALQSRDLIGVAVTGSGKTAAFLLPLLVYISELPALSELTKNDGPYAIILAPTRELAQQIEIEARKFATPLGFTCVSIVGGHSLEEQAYNLRDGAEIIIATPGRLVDCIERRLLVLSQCCYVIMDEADRMIDLGFEDPVNKILDALPVANMKPDSEEAESSYAMSQSLGGKDRYRQTMMYTATMPTAVERIARKYLRRPAIVTIGTVGEAVETVEQRVEFVSGEDKRKKRMLDILFSGEFQPPIIVFVNIKRNCDAVARDIKHMDFRPVTLHGSKTQAEREEALQSIRDGTKDVLVATDLAGRGIDVQDVSLVINFNMATNIESYTHRIGRTGRAGKSGVAITFLGNEDTDVMYDLKQMLSKSRISKVPEELRKHEAAQQKSQRAAGRKKVEESSGFGGKGGW